MDKWVKKLMSSPGNKCRTNLFFLISGHLEMVKFLLEAGADQEHKTDEMHTALMEASMDGHVEVARLLLDSGAQVSQAIDKSQLPP